MAEFLLTCPLCGATSSPAFTVTDRNRGVSDRRFHYRICSACACYFIADPPDDLARYYPETYYDLPSPADLDYAAGGEQFKLEMLSRFATPGRLVEVGSGFGVFAHAARRGGHDVTAIEMDARCCAYLESTVGVRTINSASPAEVLRGLEPSRAVALWHVLEHLPDPWAVVDAAAANLEPGGVLILATPNPRALQFRLLRGRWAHVDAPRHLFLIPADTLTERGAKAGLRRQLLTSADPATRHWNRFGWEHALRRHPARRPSTAATRAASLALMVGLRPLEGRGLNGSAYTAAFVKPV